MNVLCNSLFFFIFFFIIKIARVQQLCKIKGWRVKNPGKIINFLFLSTSKMIVHSDSSVFSFNFILIIVVILVIIQWWFFLLHEFMKIYSNYSNNSLLIKSFNASVLRHLVFFVVFFYCCESCVVNLTAFPLSPRSFFKNKLNFLFSRYLLKPAQPAVFKYSHKPETRVLMPQGMSWRIRMKTFSKH